MIWHRLNSDKGRCKIKVNSPMLQCEAINISWTKNRSSEVQLPSDLFPSVHWISCIVKTPHTSLLVRKIQQLGATQTPTVQFVHILWPDACCYTEGLIAQLYLPSCLSYCTDLATDYHCISRNLVISLTCDPLSNVVDIWERFPKLERDKVCDCTGSFP